ncbi:MAG: hypothetical protein LBI87_10880 [Candidatus Accumulibacter sp.]|jgi:hypothetical protein|nr:hypothetical protein [Accumulibacter sp.]
MKKLIGILIVLIGLYFIKLHVLGYLSNSNAEKVMAQMLPDISSPWSAKRIRFHGSDWMNRRSQLTPEEIASSAEADLGSFLEFIKKPDCEFQYGYERPSEKKIIWAMCELTARFEKRTAYFKIRLVEEPTHSPSFFWIGGDSLRLNDIPDIAYIETGVQR